MSRFRVIRGYDNGTQEGFQEGDVFQAPLAFALNTLQDNEVISAFQETRLNSGSAYYTVVVENIDFRFPPADQEVEPAAAEIDEAEA